MHGKVDIDEESMDILTVGYMMNFEIDIIN